MSKTAIIEAVRRLNVTVVKKLLKEKPQLLAVTERDGRNLVHLACCASWYKLGKTPATQVALVEYFLKQGLGLETPVGKDACTPLFFAVARARNPALVRHLIKRGAKPANAPGGALFAAAWWGDIKNLQLLLDAGADLEVVVGITPFLAAWVWRQYDAAKYLAKRGANVDVQDQQGRTALVVGVEREFDPALLRWLVRHGASPDIADNAGVTARQKASRKRDKTYIEALS